MNIFVGIVCAYLSLLPLTTLATTDIIFDENHEYNESAEKVFYFEDKHAKLSVQDALNLSDKEWSHLPGNIANFGFSSSVYWFSFDLRNNGSSQIDLYVNVDYPLLDKIDFYTV